jgi:hypothetical protein
MGRYYTGDIEGKFAFAVQSSNAADRFGKPGCEPGYLEYYYEEEDMSDLKLELKVIEEALEQHKRALQIYFDLYKTEHDAPMDFSEYLREADLPKLTEEQYKEYVDYALGRQILDCVEREGSCSFTAEL